MQVMVRALRRLLLVIEWLLGVVWGGISKVLPFWKLKPVVEVFNAVRIPLEGSEDGGVWIYGRVLSESKLVPPKPEDSGWTNFKRMLSQWFTREVPKTVVILTLGGKEIEVKSDEDGYFEFITEMELGQSCELSLKKYTFRCDVSFVGNPDMPKRVIVSDVDDTVLETGAISLGKMVKTTLFGNALTRELVPGMSEMLNKIHNGGEAPVFYVTSSPWNLHGFLGRVFKRAELPKGGIFMTDWGLTPKQWLTPDHDVHKGGALKRICGWYADQETKFLLFGDDSQKDHSIYADFIREQPEKVELAFIRSVSGEERRKEVEKMAAALNAEIGREVMVVVSGAEEIAHKL